MISSRATYEQGVLLVHGIGNQKQGDTLVRWGDALAQWLADWDPATPVRFADIHLHPAEGAPAHGDLHVGIADEKVTWLIEEVWWAGDVQTPPYSRLARFTIQALPMTLFGLVAGAVRRNRLRARESKHVGKAYHWLRVLFALVVGAPLAVVVAPVMAALIATLLVVGLVPIPGVRSRVLAVQRVLTLTIGDSMILLSSPTQRAAMVSRVVDAIRFAQARGCTKLTIVAHSQGAAIVKRALAEYAPFLPRPQLVTVGSGINRLEELERQSKTEAWLAPGLLAVSSLVGWWLWLLVDAGEVTWGEVGLWGAAYVGGALAVSALAAAAPRFVTWVTRRLAPRLAAPEITALEDAAKQPGSRVKSDELRLATRTVTEQVQGRVARAVTLALAALFLGVIGAGLLVQGESFVLIATLTAAVVLVLNALRRLVFQEPITITPDLKNKVSSWLDLYSNVDPVPNGPTITEDSSWPTSREVSNADSLLLDHVRYDRERDDSMALIAGVLLKGSHGPIRLEPGDDDRIEQARSARRGRQWMLRLSRVIVLASAAMFAIRRDGDVEAAGQDGYDWAVDTLGVPGWLPSAVNGDEALALGVIGVAVAALALYWLLAGVWSAWNTAESRALFRPGDSEVQNGALIRLAALVTGWSCVLYTGFVLDDAGELAAGDSALDWLRDVGVFAVAIVFFSIGVAALVRAVQQGRGKVPEEALAKAEAKGEAKASRAEAKSSRAEAKAKARALKAEARAVVKAPKEKAAKERAPKQKSSGKPWRKSPAEPEATPPPTPQPTVPRQHIPESVTPAPVSPAPAAPEPAAPEPAAPEPATPEPATPESAMPESATPESDTTDLRPVEPLTADHGLNGHDAPDKQTALG